MSASPVLETPSDHELAAAYRAGDERAAAELVRRHAPALGRFLYSSGAAPDEIEDLVQEALFRAFRRLDGWRGEASFRSWLFAIGGNVLRDEFRRRKGRQVLPLEDRDLPDRGRSCRPSWPRPETEERLRRRHRAAAAAPARGLPPAGPAGAGIRRDRRRAGHHARCGTSALPPRGQTTEGAGSMSDCERLSDRMPDVALRRAAWSAEEAAHLASCADCRGRVGPGARCASGSARSAPHAWIRPPSPPPFSTAWRARIAGRRRSLAGLGAGGVAARRPPSRSVIWAGVASRSGSPPLPSAEPLVPLPELEGLETAQLDTLLQTLDGSACRRLAAAMTPALDDLDTETRADARHLGGLMRVCCFRSLLLAAVVAAPRAGARTASARGRRSAPRADRAAVLRAGQGGART